MKMEKSKDLDRQRKVGGKIGRTKIQKDAARVSHECIFGWIWVAQFSFWWGKGRKWGATKQRTTTEFFSPHLLFFLWEAQLSPSPRILFLLSSMFEGECPLHS